MNLYHLVIESLRSLSKDTNDWLVTIYLFYVKMRKMGPKLFLLNLKYGLEGENQNRLVT